MENLEKDIRNSDSTDQESNIIAVDVSNDVLVDSVTDMPNAIYATDLNNSTDTNTDNEDGSKKLTLAYERLFEIPRTIVERFADHIIYLDISHNKITNLDPLVFFKHLTTLIADDNPITENCLLPPLPNLQVLWLNHCKISTLFPWINKLHQSCPDLKYLCLMGNPAAPSYLNGGTFYEYLQYRLFVISQFPSLVHLDDRTITEDQRTEALKLYKKPFFERFFRPGTSGISKMMNKSVNWGGAGKFTGFWNKGQRSSENTRNLMI